MCYNSRNSETPLGRLEVTTILRSRYPGLWIVATVACIAMCLASAVAAPQATRLTILYTNDVHGHLFPFEYDELGDQLANAGGAARRAALIRSLKAEIQNPVLVMDAGDVFNRGPLDDLKGKPDFAVMNAIGYDIMTLGNNEFKASSGPEAIQTLMERVKEARFPVVSANVLDAATGKTLVLPYKVINLKGLRIGAFGLAPPRVATYPQAKNLTIDDPISTARKIVPELRKKADLVIALTHIGFPMDLELASAVPGISAIIGGDSHTWVYQPMLVRRPDPMPSWAVGGTLVCQDGEWGRTLGRLDLELRSDGKGGYLVASYSGKLLSVDSSIAPAADVAAIIDKAAAPYRTEVGKLAADVPVSQRAEWVAERMREAAGSQIGIETREQVEQGLRAGMITRLDVRSMFPFVNKVVLAKLTGRQITNFLLSSPDAALAGARLVEGQLYVGDKKAGVSTTYTVAIEAFYAANSPALRGCEYTALNKTTPEIVADYIRAR